MEIINDLQIELTQITIRTNTLLNKRRIFFHKRLVFIANIEDVGEESYLHENNYVSCGVVIMKSGEWIKVKESYEDLKKIHSDWFKEAVDKSTTE